MRALNRKLFRDVRLQAGQLFSIALLVACGITTFVGMRSTREALRNARAAYYAQYRFADVFASLKRAPQSLSQRLNTIVGVGMVETRVVLPATLEVPGLSQLANAMLVSVPATKRAMLNDLHLYRGRYVSATRDDEAMVSVKFASANRIDVGDHLEAVVNGRWKRLRVVGIASSPEYIYEMAPGGILVDARLFGILWMRREALAASGDLVDAFNSVSLTLSNSAAERSVIAELDRVLAPYGGVGAIGRARQSSAEVIDNEMVQLDALAWFFPLLFLGIAVILLNVVLTRLITSQRGEIGTLKAFGYPDATVGTHYLALAFTAVIAGSAVGLAGAAWLGRGFTGLYLDYFGFPTLQHRTDVATATLGISASVIAAVAGAAWAVQRAVRMTPVAAMRPPAPTRFRRGALDRVRALASQPQMLMVVRDIVRRPLRSSSAAIGIGLAGATLVAGMYPFDSVKRLLDVQFKQAQRDNLMVAFVAPRDRRAVAELRSIPGVQRVEAFRVAAVRIRARHRARLTSVTGLEPAGELRAMYGGNGGRHRLPDGGIVVSSSLAAVLDISAGNQVALEFLERGGAAKLVRVVGIVDEPINGGAYMSLGALNRVVGDGDVISGANMLIDTAMAASIYRHLQHTPMVASTSSRLALLAFFERHIAENIMISASIVIAAAAVIAVGIIYNNSRITIAERARELASLRVLGFTRREVSRLFLGEEALLTLAGLPVAALAGYGLATLLARAFETERYRFPVSLLPRSYLGSIGIVLLVAMGVALVVRRRLDRLDMLGTLKTGE